jgi:hypothetical protein
MLSIITKSAEIQWAFTLVYDILFLVNNYSDGDGIEPFGDMKNCLSVAPPDILVSEVGILWKGKGRGG